MKYLAFRYGISATSMAIAAFLAHQATVVVTAIFIWTAVALSLVTVAYLGFEQHVFQRNVIVERRGYLRWPAQLLLAPYLFLSWCSYRMYTKHRFLPNNIHGNVWLGAFPRAAVANMDVTWHGVLDLTNEFPTATINAPLQKYLPVLDLTPPKPKTLVRAVRWLDSAQEQGNTLVHCALGLSRSSTVVVCWLVWRGHACDIQQAVKIVDATRAGIVLSKEHEKNIAQALKDLGHGG